MKKVCIAVLMAGLFCCGQVWACISPEEVLAVTAQTLQAQGTETTFQVLYDQYKSGQVQITHMATEGAIETYRVTQGGQTVLVGIEDNL